MKRNKLLSLNDRELDKAIKIAGTRFDRRIKLTKEDIKQMKKLYSKGNTISDIATIFNINYETARYHCIEGYKYYKNAARLMYSNNSENNYKDRVNYKKLLVVNKLI